MSGRLVLFKTMKVRADVANLIAAVQEAEELGSLSDTIALAFLTHLRSKPQLLAKIQRQIEVQDEVVPLRVIRFPSKRRS